MSKALEVLKVFFSLVSLNVTDLTQNISYNWNNTPSLAVTNSPLILKPMNSLSAKIGKASKWPVPNDMFYKIKELDLELLTRNKGPIAPTSWIRFDKELSTIFMFPLPLNEGIHLYLLVARHRKSNLEHKIEVEVHVQENTRKPNHEFVLKTGFNLYKFKTNVTTRYEFAQKIARYAVNSDTRGVSLRSVNEEVRTVIVSFDTIEDTPCNLKDISSVKRKLVDNRGRVKLALKRALSSRFMVASVSVNLLGPCIRKKKPDPGMFDWGIWRHILPPLILIVIIGGPVGISCFVRKYPGKRRRVAGQSRERRPGWKNEDFDGLFAQAKHCNDQRPSIVSVLVNANAESTSTMSSKVTSNLSSGLANGMAHSKNVNKTKNKKNDFFVGKSDLNIPCYYNFDPNQPQEPDKSVMDSTFEGFGELAGAISSKLKDIKDVAGKSVINVSSLLRTNTVDETTNDVNKWNPQTEIYDPNREAKPEVIKANNHFEGVTTTVTTTTVQNPQCSEKIYERRFRTKNRIKRDDLWEAKQEDKSPEDSDLMQGVMERLLIASSCYPNDHEQTTHITAHKANFNSSSSFRPLHKVEDHTANNTDHIYTAKDQLHNTCDATSARTSSFNTVKRGQRFNIQDSDALPNHIPLNSNTNANQYFYNGTKLHQPTETHGQLHSSNIISEGFNTTPRRKRSVIEPADGYRFGYNPSRSLNDISPSFAYDSNLEHAQVMSKSDLCLYQSNSEFGPYNDCVDSLKTEQFSFNNTGNGFYDTANNTWDYQGEVEPCTSVEKFPELTSAYSEDHTPYFYQTKKSLIQDTGTHYEIMEQEYSAYPNLANRQVGHELPSADATKSPAFAINYYDVEEPSYFSSNGNNLENFTTKRTLPGASQNSENQYEIGFTSASSYDGTLDSYNDHVSVLCSGSRLTNHPLASLNEIRADSSCDVEYLQMDNSPYHAENEPEVEQYYNQQAERSFARQNLLQEQCRNGKNSSHTYNSSQKHYLSQNMVEELSLLRNVSDSKQATNKFGSDENPTVVEFIKTKVSSILG